MSKYTTEIRFICENAAGYDKSKGYADVDEIISKSIDKIFSFDFPLFDGQYRDVLCTKILRHYYTREIGFETVGLWRLKLQTKLCEIMPYYNQLYLSELLKFNPLYDVDLKTTRVGDTASETNRTSNTSREDTRNGVSQNSANREDNKTGISANTGERNNIETNDKTASGYEGETREGNSTSKSDNTGVGFNKVNRSGNSNENGSDEKTGINSSNYSDTENATKYDLYSDTPQGALDGVEDEEYLTNARKITDGVTKTGKKADTSSEANKYTKAGSESTEENAENSVANSENASGQYGEKTDRMNASSESGNVSGHATEKNMTTNAETGKSVENSMRSNTEVGNATESGSSKDKYNSTESYVLHVAGKQGGISYSKLLTEFRKTFLNIDMEVIESLSDLFINLW